MLHESRAKLKIYISNIKINEINAYTDVSVYPNKRIPTRVQIEIFIIYRYLKNNFNKNMRLLDSSNNYII